MKSFVTTIAVIIISAGLYSPAAAQSTNDLMVTGALDLVKTDIAEPFDKAQIGFELHYFVTRKFTTSAGLEIWTFRDESFVFGSRWYLNDSFFARFRALIGENDFSIGMGAAIPIQSPFRVEIMGDYYFRGEFALRAGLSYVIRMK
jgi:hypothetical protein